MQIQVKDEIESLCITINASLQNCFAAPDTRDIIEVHHHQFSITEAQKHFLMSILTLSTIQMIKCFSENDCGAWGGGKILGAGGECERTTDGPESSKNCVHDHHVDGGLSGRKTHDDDHIDDHVMIRFLTVSFVTGKVQRSRHVQEKFREAQKNKNGQ